MSSWTFEFRVTAATQKAGTEWLRSMRKYDKPEDAAAGAAHCQAVLTVNGIMLECRLVPATEAPEQPEQPTPTNIVRGPKSVA